MVMYVRLPCNEDGSQKSYAQRRAERREQDAARRAAQKQETPTHEEFYAMSYEQRKAMRLAAEQGKVESRQLAAIEEATARQAAIDATPEHLRRPENIFTRLIAEWQSKSYRPDVAAKIKVYTEKEVGRDREIEAEMADKLRQYEVENNPETKPAREHWQKASAGAETDTERREWALLHGLIDGGAANRYWELAQPILERRLQSIEKKIVEHAGRQAPLAEEGKALATALEDTSALQVTEETDPNTEQVTE